jgi:hypothetical protein
MEKAQTITKSELAEKCGVSMRKVRQWCNVDFYAELLALGYRKAQHIFTPRQTQFLKENLLEYTDK